MRPLMESRGQNDKAELVAPSSVYGARTSLAPSFMFPLGRARFRPSPPAHAGSCTSPLVLGWFRAAVFTVLISLSLLPLRLSAFDWTILKENGRDYIPLTDVARFYGFTTVDFTNGVASLSGSAVHLQCASNSRDLYLNGLKFILSLPILDIQTKPAISRLDLAKLLDPVLRPTQIHTPPVRTVVLDAGHGGFDQGAHGPLGNEKDFALDVALRADDLFTRAGFNVRMTRSTDVYVPLESRALFSSFQQNAVFLSIHFNFGMGPDAEGIETYCLAPRGVPSTNDPRGLTLADFQTWTGNGCDSENIDLATAIHSSLITRLVVPDRGIKRARFVVLRDNSIPGVLIEGGFLTNPRDAARIASPAYRELLADAIVRGVMAYNRAVTRGSGRPPEGIASKLPGTVSSETFLGGLIWDPLKPNTFSRDVEP
jgi:N-acetylmuramoyl-L-alanine amidase